MKPRHWVFLALALVLVLVPVFAEFFYRWLIRTRVAALCDRLQETHPAWNASDPQFSRFGRSAPFDPSLTRDLEAWARWKLGWGSALDFGYRTDARVGYLNACFSHDRDGHVFLWSPRKLRYVPFYRGTFCSRLDCEWVAELQASR